MSLLVLALGGCETPSQIARIPCNFNAMEYNDVASRFMERPTGACIKKIGDTTILNVTINSYGRQNIGLWFDKRHVNEYVQAIDKYIEWNKIATERHDVVDKEISTVSTDAPGVMGIRFLFRSGAEDLHFLIISHYAPTLIDPTKGDVLQQCYDVGNALKLRQMLVDFANDKLSSAGDLDSVYK